MFNVFKAGTCWEFTSAAYTGQQKKMEKKPTKQTKSKFAKVQLLIYISLCAFVQPLGGEFCFFPFLRLGYGGCQGLCAKPDEICSSSLHEIILKHGGLSYSEERNQTLFFEIDWDGKPEINIHTLHRTEHLVAVYCRVVTPPTPTPGSGASGKLG